MSLNAVLRAVAVEPGDGEFLDEVLDRRLDRCGELTRSAAARALELVQAAVKEAGDDPRLLEALVLLGLSWPKLARRQSVDVPAFGRRAALLFEQGGDSDRGRALLEALADAFPEERGIDRDLSGLLRRLGDVDELARRYLAKAQVEIDGGRPMDAVPFLQEVLLADPGRKDIARLIRDLRYDDAEQAQARKRKRRGVGAVVLFVLLGAVLVWREVELDRQFKALTPPADNSRTELDRRLGELNEFARINPVWHGMLAVDRQIAQVDRAIDDLQRREADRAAAIATDKTRRTEAAETARLEARRLVERGRYHEAIATFEQALDLAGDDWGQAARVREDVAAVRELIEEPR
ncbi:hypothetical protein [Engelhardtia mirabilis]|uniref:Uncharacterized protein n=1 Tax=Engelhardtia mirabilis TaxID=2528011 RepID=A0A518BNS5_9BACT|nr:hypothetical protein Pla133_37250 [Planctomycetes bacterium Pla133]QDV02951.1 hypothetical protein Pla86_37240 [Planctomycetes bacterium Pla86]